MLTRNSLGKSNSSTCLHNISKPHRPFQPNISANLAFKHCKNCNLRFISFNNTSLVVAKNGNIKRVVVVSSSVEPGPPLPSGPPPNPLNWILGIFVAVVLPFIGYKWSPLMKNRFDAALSKVESVVEGVEKVAEKVEKVTEDISDGLPAGGQLRDAVDFIEHVAEKVAKKAGFVDDIIDKVQEEEEKMESSIEDKDKDKEKEKEKESETKNDSN